MSNFAAAGVRFGAPATISAALRWLRALRSSRPAFQALTITVIFVVLRLAACMFIGLGVDESYTVSISRTLSLSYFDHPPLHQWLVHATEALGATDRALRLPFVAVSGVTSWVMFLLTRRMFGSAAGVWATVALNAAGFFTAAAGCWILPDGPLNLCLLAATLTIIPVLFPEPGEAQREWASWLMTGVFLGLAGLCKYQALFFGVGLAVFFATASGQWRRLCRPAPFVAALLALAIMSPILVWNAQHDWVSFAFQGARGVANHGFRPMEAATALVGQAVILLPWMFIPLAIAAISAARGGPADQRRWLCLMLSAPAIVVFTLTPVWGERALPHWSMSGWLMLFPLLGAWLEREANIRAWPRKWAWSVLAAMLVLWVGIASEASTGWAQLAFPGLKHDPSVESIPWTNLRTIVLEKEKSSRRCLFVAGLNWRQGGKIGEAVGDLAPVRVISPDPRGFRFLGSSKALVGCDALIVGMPDALKGYGPILERSFQSVRTLAADHEGRGGRDEVNLTVLDARSLTRPLLIPDFQR